MPPFQRLPGLDGDGGMPLPWDEEGEVFDADDEEFDAAADEEFEDQPVPISGLNELASVINHPDDYPNRDHVCVVGVLFRETPLMLERLQEAAAAEAGIQFVGNLDRLRQAGDLHAGLTRLSGSIRSLHAALGTDGGIDWPVVRRAFEDDLLLLSALCEAQPESLRGRALPLLERVKAMLRALPDGPAADLDNASDDDAADASPKYSAAAELNNASGDDAADARPKCSAALITKVAQLLEDMEALLLGGVVLEYPDAGTATFLALKEEGAHEEAAEQQQQQRYIVRVEGRRHLDTILEQPHHYELQSHFSIVRFQIADAQSMFRDIQKAANEHGWWFGNIDRLQQVCKLHRNLSGISQSLQYVKMMLENKEMDWWELDSITRTTPKLTPLCELQPDNLSALILALVPRIETMLEAFPNQPDNVEDDPGYPHNLFATLVTQVAHVQEAIEGVWGTIVEYPDAESPPPSPPTQPRTQ